MNIMHGLPVSVIFHAMLFGLIAAWPATTASAESVAKAERGITGTYAFKYDGPVLRAKVQRDTATPLVVRLERKPSSAEYEARFIGNISGQYDLRDWLEHTDGSAMQSTMPMLIEVISTLPNDTRSDLFEVDGFQPSFTGGYRWGLALAVMAWLAVPITVILRRMLSQPKETEATPVVPPPSLAEQLRPLIESASRGELTTSEKARFELLLVHYWRETAGLPNLDMARSIQQLRSHQQAGPIITAVEQWLHSGESAEHHPSVEQVLRLLGPLEIATVQTEPTGAGSQSP